jgi:hypothetical protein
MQRKTKIALISAGVVGVVAAYFLLSSKTTSSPLLVKPPKAMLDNLAINARELSKAYLTT